jgi:hypothetical protein
MDDGTLAITFHPKLTAEQYAELLDAANIATTCDELCRAVVVLAKEWGVDANCVED